MNKSKFLGILLVLVGVAVIVSASYVAAIYSTAILDSIANFVTSNNLVSLKNCGVTPPSQFNVIKDDMTTVLLPSLYVGLPLIMLFLSVIMFLAGAFYYKGMLHDETIKREQMKQDLEAEIVKRVAAQVALEQKNKVPENPAPPIDVQDAEATYGARRKRN
jgi:hypothetical protein